MVTEMFKLQIQWMKEGQWEPCVYPPTDIVLAKRRCQEYTVQFPEHNYRIQQVS